jgi:hypothetical protein
MEGSSLAALRLRLSQVHMLPHSAGKVQVGDNTDGATFWCLSDPGQPLESASILPRTAQPLRMVLGGVRAQVDSLRKGTDDVTASAFPSVCPDVIILIILAELCLLHGC